MSILYWCAPIALAVGLSTLHFYLGLRFAERRSKHRARQIRHSQTPSAKASWPPHEPAYYLAVDGLLRQALRLAQESAGAMQAQLPESLSRAISELMRAAKELQESMQVVQQSQSGLGRMPTPGADPTKPHKESTAGLSGSELFRLIASCDRQESHAAVDSPAWERHPYPTWQYMAPFANDALPDPACFRQVQCHDISGGGLSFFTPESSLNERVVISVGSPPEQIFLEARITNTRAMPLEGKTTLLAGCRFVRRLGSFSQLWPTAVLRDAMQDAGVKHEHLIC